MGKEADDTLASEGRALLWHGGLMTLLGLLSGFGPLVFSGVPGTPHLIGVVQGAVLFGMAGAWYLLRASPWARSVLKYTLLVGLYGNWAGAQLSALADSGVITAGPGSAAASLATLLLSLSLLVLVTCFGILWGTRRVARSAA